MLSALLQIAIGWTCAALGSLLVNWLLLRKH